MNINKIKIKNYLSLVKFFLASPGDAGFYSDDNFSVPTTKSHFFIIIYYSIFVPKYIPHLTDVQI